MKNSQKILENIRLKYQAIQPYLNERGRRLWAAVEISSLERGGFNLLCRATGISSATISKGLKELNSSVSVLGRVRKEGGGRKKISEKQEGLVAVIEEIVDPTAKGDPESPLRWTSRSVRNDTVKQFHNLNQPTISVDSKKKGKYW